MADMTANGTKSMGERSVFFMIVAMGVGVAAIIAVAMAFLSGGDEVAADTSPAANEVGQDPTGAGTNPDGVADEANEGLMNQTATDDLVESSAASSTEGMTNTGGDGEEPATSAANVEPAVGEGNVSQMTPAEGEASDGATASGSSNDDGTDATTMTQPTEDGSENAAQSTSTEDESARQDGVTSLVDDPDNGQPNEPDGGAQEFYPTPAGPEGTDDNPLTLE